MCQSVESPNPQDKHTITSSSVSTDTRVWAGYESYRTNINKSWLDSTADLQSQSAKVHM